MEEKNFLLPLPQSRYELSSWKVAIVQYNYCVSVDRMYYSVPYDYIKREIEVRLTRNTVEMFFKGARIASHQRLHGKPGQFCIVPEHMPESHQMYHDWDKEKFLSWAHGCYCPNIAAVVEEWFRVSPTEQQACQRCSDLFYLADKYGSLRLDAACDRALVYTQNPSLKVIKSILTSGSDKLGKEQKKKNDTASSHGFTRGAAYYGRNSEC